MIIEPLGIGYLVGSQRLYSHMDGIWLIQRLAKDVWTIAHDNGVVIGVPDSYMPESCVRHIRAAIKDKWSYLQPFADKRKLRLSDESRDQLD